MSRHRNVKQWIEEDCHDYDDDDYYDYDDDDYYDEVKPKKIPSKKNREAKVVDSSSLKKKNDRTTVVIADDAKKNDGVAENNDNEKEEDRGTTLENVEAATERTIAPNETRSRLSVVVLGHVDAGKSTLMGQVLVQLGLVERRAIARYQKQAAEIGKASFALAWIMDEDESERERGVTMDIGTKHITTPHHDWTILDAPGHADYIPAMITGAASADVGLLVVAATPGEFESGLLGQTREHVILARGLGVSQLIVAINKLDAADPPWSHSRFTSIREKLLPFLLANGFMKKRIFFVPVSGLTGINVNRSVKEEESTTSLTSWYKGATLLEAMDLLEPAKRNVDKPLRFLVSDVFVEGKGITVKGRVVQGTLNVRDSIVVLPIGDEACVTRIEHGGYTTTRGDSSSLDRVVAMAGDCVDVVLLGIVDVARISPGCVLSSIRRRPHVQRRIRANIMVLERLSAPILRGARVLLHMHSLNVPAVVTKLISTTIRMDDNNNNNDDTSKQCPRMITGGSNATVEITTDDKICWEEYTDCRALGRFVLRRGGDTIAIGVVEKVISD